MLQNKWQKSSNYVCCWFVTSPHYHFQILEEKQAEIEELRSLVERLRCDQERLRQAKEEETEQLHEVINKLQEELSQLDPNHHEVSDPNTDSPESSDFPWSHHPCQQRVPEESLCQELSSHTLQSSRARLQELQTELERAAGEKDSLQRLLLSQEEQYGSQVEALGRSLGEERGMVAVLEREANELKLQLEEKRTEAERLAARVEVLGDTERAHQSRLRESELQLRRDEDQQELDRLQEEVKNQCVEKELLENHISKLQNKEEEYQNELEALQFKLDELEENVQVGKATSIALETSKRELSIEREALRKREGCLQEEIERLKQEVTSKTNYIKELLDQQEETVAKQGEAQKEVLVRYLENFFFFYQTLLTTVFVYLVFLSYCGGIWTKLLYKQTVIVMDLGCNSVTLLLSWTMM